MSQEQFTKQYINGEWVQGSSDKKVENINPYTEEVIGVIPSANAEDLDKAYKGAKQAQKEWEKLLPAEKQAYFEKLVQVMDKRKEEIIDWLVKESGSTKIKSEIEFQVAKAIVKESVSFPTRMTGTLLPSNTPGKENRVYRKAKGVVGVIGPWNFPFHLALRSIAPAIATGNTVVVKPASDAPVTAGLLIADLFEEAGFPAGVLNVAVGRGSEIGDDFLTHPIPKVFSFTGSTEVGSHIGELAGKNIKETTLELGGNNAMIVLEDADIDKAVEAAAFGKYLHQGQICMAINRVIVHEQVHDQFVEAFKKKVEGLKAGDPSEDDTVVGPLINRDQVERIQKDIEESLQQGATKLIDGDVKGNMMDPIVLTDVTNEMPIAKNEIFGPVMPIIQVKDEEQAIRFANGTPYGLSGSVFTEDRHRGALVADQIETGMIHINDQSVNDEAHVAFGGEKDSGVGRFNGQWAIDKFTTEKWISVQNEYREFPF
ncbi:aldehyde dehydrogenase (NAD+) [Thalassobacillus cyri]|uniref:Aldehyde dehydrogenase n=1 Tax=Thalassobacillus cyri TaxID=571932 RepID=A0A1H4ESB9_9BACI|nr:aldehyde dehydrogenase family protein [Thalassobacillus cyri]SEA87400.1 aldehyde dehydrogenase (NAD+) [Thalassobacillus cyri]